MIIKEGPRKKKKERTTLAHCGKICQDTLNASGYAYEYVPKYPDSDTDKSSFLKK